MATRHTSARAFGITFLFFLLASDEQQQRPPPPPYSGSDTGDPEDPPGTHTGFPFGGAAREFTAPASYMSGPAVGDAGASRQGRAPAASFRVGTAVGVADAADEGSRKLVLPRPPSDQEKVMRAGVTRLSRTVVAPSAIDAEPAAFLVCFPGHPLVSLPARILDHPFAP